MNSTDALDRTTVWMVGTDPQGAGGIASVLKAYQTAGLGRAQSPRVRFWPTHFEGRPVRGALAWFSACLIVIVLAALAKLQRRTLIVHAHSASRGSFLRKSLLLAVARAVGVRTVLHLHGGGFQAFVERQCGPLGRAWVRFSLREAALVITLSQRWRAYVESLAPQANVAVLANPIVIGRVSLRHPEPGRLLFLGRIDRRKGVYDLIDALAGGSRAGDEGATAQLSNVRLVVAGDGDSADLQAYAQRAGVARQVEILGWIGPQERARQLARAELFVLPSHHEGLPMAMLEAMAAGVPVLASAVGGIPDLVSHQVEGWLVPPQSVAMLRAALIALLANPRLQQQMVEAARARIRAECESGQVLERLNQLWLALVAAPFIGAGSAAPSTSNPIVSKGSL